MDYVIIVAGGKGLRMGGDVPKQFAVVAGLPVLMRTVLRFRQSLPQAQIILALPKAHQDYWAQLCREYNFTEPHLVADGGETRFHSVSNALRLVPANADGIVAVHDGVRPFASQETILRAFEGAREMGAVVPVVAPVETVRQLLDGGASQTVNRDNYRLVQTPQAFRIALLKQAYEQDFTPMFTDDASVVEALGHEVALVEGNRENIKLTTPSDLKYAEFLCQG